MEEMQRQVDFCLVSVCLARKSLSFVPNKRPQWQFESSRETNIATQLKAGRWPLLESYTGSLLDLYVSGIPGRINAITVEPFPKAHWELFDPVVSQARPRELTITIMRVNITHRIVHEMLRSPGLGELTKLTLTISVREDKDRSVNTVFDDFVVCITTQSSAL